MEERELLLRLVYRALIDIRMASADGDARTSWRIANLLHNIPLAMIRGEGRKVLDELTGKAEGLGMSSWMHVALRDIKANEGGGETV